MEVRNEQFPIDEKGMRHGQSDNPRGDSYRPALIPAVPVDWKHRYHTLEAAINAVIDNEDWEATANHPDSSDRAEVISVLVMFRELDNP